MPTAPQSPLLPREIPVYCPFPLRTSHADVDHIDAQAVNWCLRHGLIIDPDDVATQMHCATAIAAALPHAHEASILAATKWMYFGSLLDDFWDSQVDHLPQLLAHAGELNRVMAGAPDTPVPLGDRWAASLQELRGEIEASITDEQIRIWRYETSIWLSGQTWYTALRRQATPPDLGQYLRARWAKCGVGTLIAFTGSPTAVPVPAHILDAPPVRAFVESTLMACVLINDLASSAKEFAAGTAELNIISVLAHAENTDIAAATVAAVQLYEQVVGVAAALQRRLRTDPRPGLAQFALDLPNWLPAGIAWASRTTRYHDPSVLNPGSSSVSITPSEFPILWDPENHTPPDHPEIQGWWRHAEFTEHAAARRTGPRP